MSEKKRTIMSGAQKAKVALAAVKGNKTVNEIAQEFGVHPTQVGLWKKALLENAGQLFDVKRGSKAPDPQSDPERLYAKIGQLNMELEWLKKSPGSAPKPTAGLDRFKRWAVCSGAVPAGGHCAVNGLCG
jgi:transposase